MLVSSQMFDYMYLKLLWILVPHQQIVYMFSG